MKAIYSLLPSIAIGMLILTVWSLAAWPYMVGSYAQLLAYLLRPLVSQGTELQVTQSEIIVYDYKGTAIVRKNLSSLNEFGLLLALFLAIPTIPLLQRVRRLLFASALQILLHVVMLLLLIWIAYEFYFGINKQSFAYWLLNLLMAGNLFFPILIWALLTWRSWLPKPAQHKSSRAMKEARP